MLVRGRPRSIYCALLVCQVMVLQSCVHRPPPDVPAASGSTETVALPANDSYDAILVSPSNDGLDDVIAYHTDEDLYSAVTNVAAGADAVQQAASDLRSERAFMLASGLEGRAQAHRGIAVLFKPDDGIPFWVFSQCVKPRSKFGAVPPEERAPAAEQRGIANGASASAPNQPQQAASAAPAPPTPRQERGLAPPDMIYEVIETRFVRKGGSTRPLRSPPYELAVVDAALSKSAYTELTHDSIDRLLRKILIETKERLQRSRHVDGVSVILHQSNEHRLGGGVAIGTADWWPRGHSFSPSNDANVADKSSYETTVRVLRVPASADESVRHGLSEAERQSILREIVRAEDRAERDAATRSGWRKMNEAGGIPDRETVQSVSVRYAELTSELQRTYRREVLRKHGLTDKQGTAIIVESIEKNWPLPKR